MQAPDSGVLFQEEMRSEPFWMLVACIMINRTHWRQVKPVLERVRARWQGPEELAKATKEELGPVIKSLGFWNVRSQKLIAFARAWLDKPVQHWSELAHPGCGMYAKQSFMIFVNGEKPPLSEVVDHKLQWYLQHR